MREGVPWHPEHGWLAAVLPASARTFRSTDAQLAATLEASGAVAAAQPDVELATTAAALRGDADCAVVYLHRSAREGAGLPGRVAGRLAGVAQTARGVDAARRRLRRLGHTRVETVPFDPERRPALAPPGLADARALPLSAIVVGRRAEALGPTILQAAGEAASEPVVPADARAGLSGVVLALGDRRVLRAVMCAGGEQIGAGVGFLAALRAAGPSPEVADRIAWPAAEGELALARWVVEPRLAGDAPDLAGEAVLADCVEFLAELFTARVDANAGAGAGDLAAAGGLVASACPSELAGAVAALGERLEGELAGLPRGVAHGDFWRDNLLAAGSRLTGVVDWSGAGGGRLPLLDLFHLLVDRAGGQLGDAVTGWLLPEAERGGGPLVAAYCRRLGLEASPALLRSAAAAYWLDHVAHHLRSYADRRARPAWLARNVHVPARALTSGP